jgi:hypothetical protein
MFDYVITIVTGNSMAISTSNISKITAIRKNRSENGSRADLLGWNPHSNCYPFSWSSVFFYSFWLQIQRSCFDSRRYQIFRVVVSLERGPLSLMSTIKESREYGRRNPSRWPLGTIYPQKLSLTSPTRGVRSGYIVRLRKLRPRSFFFTYSTWITWWSHTSILPKHVVSKKTCVCVKVALSFYLKSTHSES